MWHGKPDPPEEVSSFTNGPKEATQCRCLVCTTCRPKEKTSLGRGEWVTWEELNHTRRQVEGLFESYRRDWGSCRSGGCAFSQHAFNVDTIFSLFSYVQGFSRVVAVYGLSRVDLGEGEDAGEEVVGFISFVRRQAHHRLVTSAQTSWSAFALDHHWYCCIFRLEIYVASSYKPGRMKVVGDVRL